MAPVSPVFPSLRVDRVDQYLGDRQQQSQFTNGSIVKGRITGKQGNQFVLEVDGRKWVASSRTPLQVGQNLNLQVTATKPAVTLQILTDPLTSQVGKSVYLLADEGSLVPRTLELASQIPQENLSTASRQTLDFFQKSTSLLTAPDQSTSSLSSRYGEQLARLIRQVLAGQDQPAKQELRDFLQAIIQKLPDNSSAGKEAQSLLALLENSKDGDTLSPLLISADSGKEAMQQFDILARQLASSGPAGQSLAEALQLFRGDKNQFLPTPFLFRLIGLVTNMETETGQKQPEAPVSGQQLKEVIDRIGTNLERLLAEGKTDQAAATLKSALLEIRDQYGSKEPVASQAGHLSATIEAIQLLQVRLAQDSIFLLPLPFPFLEQGFLVVNQENPGQAGREDKKEAPTRYSLYLQLEGLGNLRIDLQQGSTGTRIFFYAQDSERTSFLSRNQDELLDLLTATTPETIRFLTGSEEPVKSLLARITDTGTTVLNTTA